MYTHTNPVNEIIPAHLGFLSIYNPSLGSTDESVKNQIIYYFSPNSKEKGKRKGGKKESRDRSSLHNETDEQLRQVGLAQGIVEFGKSFSGGKAVETIDTERSRIILKEFESGWWILASINLSVLPKKTSSATYSEKKTNVEYSSRDVKPAEILLNDLLRAHSIFLLHHAPSINEFFEQTKRPKFMNILSRYWDVFASRWNVLMHGNPANSLYLGVKLAPCGELGIGVGEESRCSAEREVLEGLGHQVEGMVDIIVSKFGDEEMPDTGFSEEDISKKLWIGQGNEPSANDGAIFLGTGALSRTSLRNLYFWIEDLYRWGIYAYGVNDDPSLWRHKKRSRKEESSDVSKDCLGPNGSKGKINELKPQARDNSFNNQEIAVQEPELLYPTISEDTESLDDKKHHDVKSHYDRVSLIHTGSNSGPSKKIDLVDYFKLGYKTLWSLSGNLSRTELEKADSNENSSITFGLSLSDPDNISVTARLASNKRFRPTGHFLIGLTSNLEDNKQIDSSQILKGQGAGSGATIQNSNISQRKLTLALDHDDNLSSKTRDQIPNIASQYNESSSQKSFETQSCKKFESLQVVVYTSKPFIFVFLLAPDACALASPEFYNSLQHKLQPILNPLAKFAKSGASKPNIKREDTFESPIFDLIWDPKNLTISSTIPNIPDISQIYAPASESLPWSVLEALNTHMQIIKSYIASRDSSELERLCKTSRGWWIFWTRIPEPIKKQSQIMPSRLVDEHMNFSTEDTIDTSSMVDQDSNASKKSLRIQGISSDNSHSIQKSTLASQNLCSTKNEVFIIRRTSDSVPARSMSRRSIASSSVGSERDSVNEASIFARGIGFNTKRYVECLLNLGL
ncbi:putative vacuolar fusion protein ccz1 protein [Golovinomyces cichoracearum]|uniref:Putative vacuolar fusion protein ccz1 protein n=1 Tax=Golovinomyces cichoracearum TaxID=62708 RepID=A0A420ILM2_9PEZI|nr:putative vacuolar fusion protein ccz1 protein [Golovinomyces cichoracearum]